MTCQNPRRLVETGVLQRFEEVGAGQVQVQRVAARHQGQVEFLGIHTEAMARTEADDVAALLEQFALVAQGAHRLVAGGLQACLDVVGLDAVLQFAKAFGQFAQLEDQRVGGEERIQARPPR